MIGQALLVTAGVASVCAMAAALVASRFAGRSRSVATARLAQWATHLSGLAVVCLWGAVATLAFAIMRLDTSYAYVATQTRSDMSRALRFSALWSGAEGSLLLFTAVLASALYVGNRSARRTGRAPRTDPGNEQLPALAAPGWQLAWGAATISGFTLASVRGANPFQRLQLPPLSGAGMAPILEHFAMIIHPPLLYGGMCLALVPALARNPRSAHRWAMGAMTVLTLALGFGSAWAYVELGWGGWWAWDPIENVALIVWLLLASGLHWKPLDPEQHTGRGPLNAVVVWALCWPAVIGGAALTRTSLRTSVHAFADAAQLSVWLWPLAALAAVAAMARVWEQAQASSIVYSKPADLVSRTPQAILVAAGVIVAAGTYRPFIGGDGTAGWFYSQTLYPLAIVGAVLIGVVPLWNRETQSGGAGLPLSGLPTETMVRWGVPGAIAVAVGAALGGWTEWFQLLLGAAIGFGGALVLSSGRQGVARLAGHLGVLLVLFGALAGTVSTDSVARLGVGQSAVVDGHRVELLSADIVDEQPLRAEVRLLIDGAYELRPSVTVYADRNLRLPEVSTRTRPWLDSQAVLRDFDAEAGALVTLLFRPWNQLVWWGVGLLTLAAALLVVDGLAPTSAADQRRSRLALSSSDIADGSG